MVLIYWMLVLANAAGFGTLAVGWWAVPVVALVGASFAPRGSKPLLSVPLGCAVGWGALLLRSARADSFADLTALIGQLFPVPPAGLAAASIGLALVLALGAALIGAGLRRTGSES